MLTRAVEAAGLVALAVGRSRVEGGSDKGRDSQHGEESDEVHFEG
jgi:hypothetical protein